MTLLKPVDIWSGMEEQLSLRNFTSLINQLQSADRFIKHYPGLAEIRPLSNGLGGKASLELASVSTAGQH